MFARLDRHSPAVTRHSKAAGTSPETLLFARHGEIFAAHRLAEHAVPTEPSFVTFTVDLRTSETGQRLFVALLDTESLKEGSRHRGLAVSIDSETGAVEDFINGQGVIGYLNGVPFEAGASGTLRIEAWLYGEVFIPRLAMGHESVLHPALLLKAGSSFTALAGSDITQGSAAQCDRAMLMSRPIGV